MVGKRWVHQAAAYDRVTGVSTWTKNYRTPLDQRFGDSGHVYCDPVHTLPEEGQEFWRGATPAWSDLPTLEVRR